MGFFDNMFQQQLKEGWKELTSLSELEELNTRSFEKPMVIFKHSTRCGISAHAKDKLNAIKISDAFDFYYLDLISNRDVSHRIADKYSVTHQSPQLIIIKEGQAVFHTSHQGVSAEAVEQNIS